MSQYKQRACQLEQQGTTACVPSLMSPAGDSQSSPHMCELTFDRSSDAGLIADKVDKVFAWKASAGVRRSAPCFNSLKRILGFKLQACLYPLKDLEESSRLREQRSQKQ